MKTQMECLVSISCITYNHVHYIAQAIDGFLMQKTAFPFEVLVHDDASTDGTADIIREYERKHPDLIFPIFQAENQYSKGIRGMSVRFNSPRARGKYIALCEGDDYWTDPLKLQKQVDFLEANPEYTLCCGAYQTLNASTGELNVVNLYDRIKRNNYLASSFNGASFGLEEMEHTWLVATHTVLYLKDALQEFATKDYRYSRDINLYYHIVKTGKAFYLNDMLGVYRIHDGGVHSGNLGRVENNLVYQCRRELYEKNGDEFTRRTYLRTVMRLFGYDLFHAYEGNTIKRRLGLLREALQLIRRKSEYIWLFRPFIPASVRRWLIALYNRSF